MSTVLDDFWRTVENVKENSSLFDPIRSPFHPLNSPFHPLRSPYHPLKSPFHPLNNQFNPNRGRQRLKLLQELINDYIR